MLGLPAVPFSLETLGIILPYSLALAAVGLLESLMTARAGRRHHRDPLRQGPRARGQGIANVVTGFFGGMAGCAMIGQTMINVRVSGARTRISTFCAGLFLLVLVVALGDLVAIIPMAALVAVMVLVSLSTFDWHSIAPTTLKRMPPSETVVMVVTVAGTVATDNLAIGVGAGVLTAMAAFARQVAHLVDVERVLDPDGTAVFYSVKGELFFASDQELVDSFDYAGDPSRVLIDFSHAHVWDASAVAALDAIEQHYARHGARSRSPGSTRQRRAARHPLRRRWRPRTDGPPDARATLHIGEVAERVGLSLRTVRYYEEQGLFAPAGRTEGGFRLYTEREVDRLLLIKQMKPLGFTVQQMRELLAAHDALGSRRRRDPPRCRAPDRRVRRAGRRALRGAARSARPRRGVRPRARPRSMRAAMPSSTRSRPNAKSSSGVAGRRRSRPRASPPARGSPRVEPGGTTASTVSSGTWKRSRAGPEHVAVDAASTISALSPSCRPVPRQRLEPAVEPGELRVRVEHARDRDVDAPRVARQHVEHRAATTPPAPRASPRCRTAAACRARRRASAASGRPCSATWR